MQKTSIVFFIRFMLGALLTLFAANALASALDLRWQHVPNHSYLNVADGFRGSPNDVDVVFFGTSATRNSVVPELISTRLETALGRDVECWNLAMPNSTPEVFTRLAETVLGDSRPRLLVLEAAPMMWDADRRTHTATEVFWRWFADLPDLLRYSRTLDGRKLRECLRGLDWGMEALWNRSGILMQGELKGSHPTGPFGGVYGLDQLEIEVPPEQLLSNTSHKREQDRVSMYATTSAWRAELHRIAEQCREKNVTLLLLHQPVYPELLSLFEPGVYEEFLQWITAAAEEEQVELLVLHGAWPMEDEQFFRDYIHYSPRGAAWFSTKLADEVLLPRLRGLAVDGHDTR
jgi:hypothetical protein